MTEEPRSFTVKDRRHFTPDGQAREPEEGTAAESGPPEARPAADQTPESEGATRAAGPKGKASGPIDFAQFLLSLGTQASLLLSGEIEGADAAQALGEARSVIAILEMLKDKTEGRREPHEDQVLEGLLYELRMAYVERAREVGE
jgi:hypothetical protein